MARTKKPIEGQEAMFAPKADEGQPPPTSAVTGLPTEAHARRTDPSTSHAAARSVGNLTKKQLAVHALLRKNGSMTDEQLVRTYREAVDKKITFNGVLLPEQSDSGIRTRRSELAKHEPPLVKVKDVVTRQGNRKHQRWEAIPIGEAMEAA
jgi:hypothetical protein